MSNPIAPSVTFPSPNEYPNTIRTITNLQKGSITTVTAPSNTLTTQDEGLTTVVFLQVIGMAQINGLPGRVIQVIDSNTFTVDIDSLNFYPYLSGGVFSIVTGHPPIENASFQYFNTPFQNIA